MNLAQSHEKKDKDKPHAGSVIRDLLEKESLPEAPDHLPTTNEQFGVYRIPLQRWRLCHILWHSKQLSYCKAI